MTARELWEQELRAGVDGQDRAHPSTWHLDPLWRAACCEASAREWDAICPAAAAEWRAKGDAYLGAHLDAIIADGEHQEAA